MPKLVVVTLIVFYIMFITTFAGIRGVDQRLIDMARIIGASETRDRARDHLEIAVAVLLHRPEGRVAARGQRHHRRRVPGRDRGRRLTPSSMPGKSSDTTGVFAGIVVAMALVLAINAVVNVDRAPRAGLAAGRARNGVVGP